MILQKPPEQSKWVERERPKHKTADFANNLKSIRRSAQFPDGSPFACRRNQAEG